MPKKKDNIELSKLDLVTNTIVYEMKEVGVYRYCKLAYLFEYFFIKNFGKRYTKECFIKLPHGPAITDYKKQIANLHSAGLIETDIDELKRQHKLDDFNESIRIRPTATSKNHLIPEEMAYELLRQVIRKFGHISLNDLEAAVYKTSPVVKYVQSHFKPKNGGYVLKGDCIRLKDYQNARTKGRELAMEHLHKYPPMDSETEAKIMKEFESFERLRPTLWELLESN